MTQYGVILADPPWSYRNGGNGRARAHYSTMTIEDIRALPISDLAKPDAVLLMWCTWPQLKDGLSVIDAWGFDYISGFPWVKVYDPPFVDLLGDFIARPTWGTGSWVRGCSEPLLIAKRGKAKPPEANWMGLISQRMAHSRKPDSVHQYAESFPGPYLELFARRPMADWDVWGNQAPDSISLLEAMTP